MTRYEQGFMKKCAEYGVDGRRVLDGLRKKAALFNVDDNGEAVAYDAPAYDENDRPITQWGNTNSTVVATTPHADGFTGRYKLPNGWAGLTNGPSATLQGEYVKKPWLFGKPSTNWVDLAAWEGDPRNLTGNLMPVDHKLLPDGAKSGPTFWPNVDRPNEGFRFARRYMASPALEALLKAIERPKVEKK